MSTHSVPSGATEVPVTAIKCAEVGSQAILHAIGRPPIAKNLAGRIYRITRYHNVALLLPLKMDRPFEGSCCAVLQRKINRRANGRDLRRIALLRRCPWAVRIDLGDRLVGRVRNACTEAELPQRVVDDARRDHT
jgi:hypothetical protein